MRKAIAIDFDGCLCEDSWPEIGAANMTVVRAALEEQRRGAALILWTCRVGERLEEAVRFCKDLGLTFDAVNANLPERIAAYRNDCRKVNADEYWDDRAVHVPAPVSRPLSLEELQEMEGEPVWYVDLNRSHPKGFWAIIAGVVSPEDCEVGEYGDGPGVWLTFLDCQDYGPEAEYGKTWLAYRRKPEEGET